ncbi:hypothetical protein KEM52_005336, partial [Ascosphaera acerosa]
GSRQVYRLRPHRMHNRPRQRDHRDQPPGRQEQAVRRRGQAGRRAHHQAAEVRPGRPAQGEREGV